MEIHSRRICDVLDRHRRSGQIDLDEVEALVVFADGRHDIETVCDTLDRLATRLKNARLPRLLELTRKNLVEAEQRTGGGLPNTEANNAAWLENMRLQKLHNEDIEF